MTVIEDRKRIRCVWQADWLVDRGGRIVLTGVPEMFGAERGLLNRAASLDVFERGVEMINGFKRYFIRYGQTVYENPSPGNKEGGITILEDKSIGCTQYRVKILFVVLCTVGISVLGRMALQITHN